MTIIVATLCEKGKAGVIAADKMVTYGYGFLEYDSPQTKLMPVQDRVIIGAAGEATLPSEIVQSLKFNLKQQKRSNHSMKEIIDILKDEFFARRMQYLQENIFNKIGIKREDFIKDQKDFVPEVATKLFDDMFTEDPDVDFLVLGKDEFSIHLYHISGTGSSENLSSIGYGAIGSGEHFAEISLALEPYDTNCTLDQAVVSTFFAKKSSEPASGVGTQTQMYVLTMNSKPIPIPQKDLEILEEVYSKTQKELKKLRNDLTFNQRNLFQYKKSLKDRSAKDDKQ